MPYGAVLCMFMLTAFAVLYSRYLCLHWYPCHVWYGTLDTPIHEPPAFSPVDSYTHNRNRSDCLGTWLVLLQHHSHTRQTYMQAYQKIYSTMQNRCAVPVYDYASYFLLSVPQCRWFGFHESAW